MTLRRAEVCLQMWLAFPFLNFQLHLLIQSPSFSLQQNPLVLEPQSGPAGSHTMGSYSWCAAGNVTACLVSVFPLGAPQGHRSGFIHIYIPVNTSQCLVGNGLTKASWMNEIQTYSWVFRITNSVWCWCSLWCISSLASCGSLFSLRLKNEARLLTLQKVSPISKDVL